jgi:hypothetical protein
MQDPDDRVSGGEQVTARCRIYLDSLPDGERAVVMAHLMSAWLATHHRDAWPSLLAMHSQTVISLAEVVQGRRQKRRVGGEA